MRWSLTMALFALLFPLCANAEEPGDPRAGLAFALVHCAECHAVSSADKMSPNSAAPSFVSVANSSGMTGRALAVWLETSHPTMPNLVLAQKDRDNVIAYIMDLKPQPAH
jgi:mono/diheme cytochrome c family protein